MAPNNPRFNNKLLIFLLAALLVFSVLLVVRFFLGRDVLKKNDLYLADLQRTYNQENNTNTADLNQGILKATDPFIGNTKAKNVIVLFSYFQCTYCSDMNLVLKDLMVKHQNDILLIWKDMPNPVHVEAASAALAARCAAKQDKFWQYHDELFASQTTLSSSLYPKIAQKIGLDEKVFQQCFNNQEQAGLVTDSFVLGSSLGVDATPYLFVNGQRLSGLVKIETIEKLLK